MAKYARIILHAGLSKTGSTTVQDNCALHSEFLKQHAVLYPTFTFEGEPFANHSIVITAAVSSKPARYGLRLPERYPGREQAVLAACAEQLSEILAQGDGQTLVLSTELVENFGVSDALALRDALLDAADELVVMALVRSPESALTSLMQERVKAGFNVSPRLLAGRVKAKCERLQAYFGDHMQFADYHGFSRHPQGLVGAWFEFLGIRPEEMAQLGFISRNASLCQEAYLLMHAVNRALPLRELSVHKVPRTPYDLDFLMQLPGQDFMIDRARAFKAYRVCQEERAWLRDELGLVFPEDNPIVQGELWQPDTVAALEHLLEKIEQPAVRDVVADELGVQAQQESQARPAVAQQLQAIADALRGSGN